MIVIAKQKSVKLLLNGSSTATTKKKLKSRSILEIIVTHYAGAAALEKSRVRSRVLHQSCRAAGTAAAAAAGWRWRDGQVNKLI